MPGKNGETLHLGAALELFAQGLGQVGQLVKIGRTTLVDPAKQLGGAKALFTQAFAKRGQTFQIEVEKIDRCHA